MKVKFKYFLIVLFLLLVSGRLTNAQVFIPDPNFRAFLVANHPTLMNPDQTLNVVAANAFSGLFKCYNQNITDLTGIENFINAKSLEVKYNPGLTALPNIDALTKLTILGLDSNGLTSLPNLSTLTLLQILSFHHNKISSIPSLAGLTQLTTFFCHYNNLTTLPDLSSQTNLSQIIFSNNPITSLPSFSNLTSLNQIICDNTLITTFPDVSNCLSLSSIICRKHLLTSLPNLSINTNLDELLINTGKLTSLPSFSGLSLTSVNISKNELSFEDIVPLTSQAAYGSFVLSPQSPGVVSSVDALNTMPYDLSLGFDNAVNNSVYTWYKNGVFFSTTSTNKITFNPASLADAAVYTCTITNTSPALSAITLNSAALTLRVIPCIGSNSIVYQLINPDCSYPILVKIDNSSFTTGTAPFSYKARNNQDSTAFTSIDISLSKEGTYDLIVKDALGCKVIFDSKLIVTRNSDCDPVFYPNGDGIADTYFIEETGHAKIYNKNGEIIKELTTPANWDGTNKKGQEAPTGLYIIVVNETVNIKITILR